MDRDAYSPQPSAATQDQDCATLDAPMETGPVAPTRAGALLSEAVARAKAAADQSANDEDAALLSREAGRTRSMGARLTAILNRLAATEAHDGLGSLDRRRFSARAGAIAEARAAADLSALAPHADAPPTRRAEDAAARFDIVMPPVPPGQSDFAGPMWRTGAWPTSVGLAGGLALMLVASASLFSFDPTAPEPAVFEATTVASLDGPLFDASAFEIVARADAADQALALEAEIARGRFETALIPPSVEIVTDSVPAPLGRGVGPHPAAFEAEAGAETTGYLAGAALERLLSERPVKCIVPTPLPGADPAKAASARDLDALRAAGAVAAACVERVSYRPDAMLMRRVAPAPEGARIEMNGAYSIRGDAVCHKSRGLTALVVGGALAPRKARSLENVLAASFAALEGAPICHRFVKLGEGPEGPVFRAVAYVNGERSLERTDPRPFVMQRRETAL